MSQLKNLEQIKFINEAVSNVKTLQTMSRDILKQSKYTKLKKCIDFSNFDDNSDSFAHWHVAKFYTNARAAMREDGMEEFCDIIMEFCKELSKKSKKKIDSTGDDWDEGFIRFK